MTKEVRVYLKSPITTKNVVCTGFFDGWQGTQKMVPIEIDPVNKIKLFYVKINVDEHEKEFIFKFLEDNTWTLSPFYKTRYSGVFENNILLLESEEPPRITLCEDEEEEEKTNAVVPRQMKSEKENKNENEDEDEDEIKGKVKRYIKQEIRKKMEYFRPSFMYRPKDSGADLNKNTSPMTEKKSSLLNWKKKVQSFLFPWTGSKQKSVRTPFSFLKVNNKGKDIDRTFKFTLDLGLKWK